MLETVYERILRDFNESTEGLERDVEIVKLCDGRRAQVSIRVEVIS